MRQLILQGTTPHGSPHHHRNLVRGTIEATHVSRVSQIGWSLPIDQAMEFRV